MSKFKFFSFKRSTALALIGFSTHLVTQLIIKFKVLQTLWQVFTVDFVFDESIWIAVLIEIFQVKMAAEAENDLIGSQFMIQSILLLRLAKDQVKIILAWHEESLMLRHPSLSSYNSSKLRKLV